MKKPHGRTRALKNFLPGGLCDPVQQQRRLRQIDVVATTKNHWIDLLSPEFEGMHYLRELQKSDNILDRELADTFDRVAREALWTVMDLDRMMLVYKPIIEALRKREKQT